MFCLIFKCVSIVLCVPFLTLFERKILSYSQNRKGPKKISIFGLFQPMVDGIKLVLKESGIPFFGKKIFFFASPIYFFFFSLFCTMIFSKNFNSFILNFGFLLFLVLVSFNIFPFFMSGVSSKSKYSSMGSFRSAAQVISYEVNFVSAIIVPLVLLKNFSSYWNFSKNFFCFFLFPSIFVMWIFCMVSETNRTPFDFAEGESELVSGFNTEYSGLNFTFLFLAEYSNIMLMSIITSILFFKVSVSLIFIYLFIAFRSTFPRFRYDLLMTFSWKMMLTSMLYLYFFLFFFII